MTKKTKNQTDTVLDEGFSESILETAKKLIKLSAKIKSNGLKEKELKAELLKYVNKNGSTTESGTVSMDMAGKKFSVIKSVMETYEVPGILKVFQNKGMTEDRIDLALPITRKVDTAVIEGMINSGQLSLDDIKSFISEKDKTPYLKVTAGSK